jgi:hypothetical protein
MCTNPLGFGTRTSTKFYKGIQIGDMQTWDQIINTALLGTDKRPPAASELPAGLAEAAALIVSMFSTGLANIERDP